MTDTVVSRFVIRKRPFYIRTTWGKTDFHMEMTDGKHVWTGVADSTYVASKLKPQGMDVTEYISIIRDALTKQDVECKRFQYFIEQSPDNPADLELSWKIRLSTEDIPGEDPWAFHMRGSLKLHRISMTQPNTTNPAISFQNIMQQFMDWLIDRVTILSTTNADLQDKNKELQKQRNESLTRFDKLVADKKQLEREMYEKFVTVLNEKKRKIRELHEEVNNGPSLKLKPYAVPTKSKKGYDDGTDSDDTSDENDHPTPVQEYLASPGSSHKTTPSLTFNNTYDPTPSLSVDLLLHDEEHTVKASVRRRHKNVEEDNSQKIPPSPIEIVPNKKEELMKKMIEKKEAKKPLTSPLKASFQMEVPRSPGMVTPSPTKMRYNSKKRKTTSQNADDLFDEMMND